MKGEQKEVEISSSQYCIQVPAKEDTGTKIGALIIQAQTISPRDRLTEDAPRPSPEQLRAEKACLEREPILAVVGALRARLEGLWKFKAGKWSCACDAVNRFPLTVARSHLEHRDNWTGVRNHLEVVVSGAVGSAGD
eukprot:scaffold6452_cov20-Tisochrysis_lutea.AAC.2